jgi:hypothetical protein
MINVDHSSCLALAGTFEPCYILTITTLPSQMQPVTNKRNAALIQSFMADILSVSPERGIVRFAAIPAENLAMGGATMLGRIEDAEQEQNGNTAVKRTISESRKSMPVFARKSAPRKDSFPSHTKGAHSLQTTSNGRRESDSSTPEPLSPIPNVFELAGAKEEERPTTAGGSYAALNGLRLNGVSTEDLVGANSRTSNGRPKTFSGTSAIPDIDETEPLPTTNGDSHNRPAKPPAERRRSANITSPKPTSTPQAASSARSYSRTLSGPAPTVKSSLSTKAADRASVPRSVSTTSAAKAAAAKAAIGSPSPSPAPLDGRDPAANTAKRRSTVTATPKLPIAPPVPESKPVKVSKRKSFFGAFRK